LTLHLLGMELMHAENLLTALNKPYRVVYYYAKKPLADTDSVRVIRQRESDGCVELTVSAFKTKIDA
jgi:hypothetical protein